MMKPKEDLLMQAGLGGQTLDEFKPLMPNPDGG
jgi:hypothetical protein